MGNDFDFDSIVCSVFFLDQPYTYIYIYINISNEIKYSWYTCTVCRYGKRNAAHVKNSITNKTEILVKTKTECTK
jgi:hypothetical protein